MISEANIRTIGEIADILGVYFKGTTDKEAEAFIRKYEPLVDEAFDFIILADKCYMDADDSNN